jgi:hypothetical protein
MFRRNAFSSVVDYEGWQKEDKARTKELVIDVLNRVAKREGLNLGFFVPELGLKPEGRHTFWNPPVVPTNKEGK